MRRIYNHIPYKYRFYLPIVAGIVVLVFAVTLYSVQRAKRIIYESIERNLQMELQTILGLFEREESAKKEKVLSAGKVIHELFYSRRLSWDPAPVTIEVMDQVTQEKHPLWFRPMNLEGKKMYGDSSFVDLVTSLTGVSATVFQRIDSGYLRIATNVRNSLGYRALNTYIPFSSPVIREIESGKPYSGRAWVVNDWYYTWYEPILFENRVVGMLYVGDKEKDIRKLRNILHGIQVGKSGYPFVIDEYGTLVIHPDAEGENWIDEPVNPWIIESVRGIKHYALDRDGIRKIVAYDYFKPFGLYVGVTMPVRDETQGVIEKIVLNSVVIGILLIMVISVIVYLATEENMKKLLVRIERSETRQKRVEIALEQSEKYIKTIFDNSSDTIFIIDFSGNILEVNKVAIDTLGYPGEEFQGKKIADISSAGVRKNVNNDLVMVSKFGQYRHESELVTRDGKVIPVDMNSRIIEYRGSQAILVISWDISDRKEMEERILTTIIQTEDNERKRISADLHDGLAPILSTIKLYAGLLKKGHLKNIDPDETIKNIEELVDMAITSTREISRNIRPNILQDFGLAAAINDYVAYINHTRSISITTDTDQYLSDKRGIEESILYQAVKELINNSIKHSSAKNAVIELKSSNQQVILYYRDDGSGFDIHKAMEERKGLGLNNLVNKIRSIKGTVDLHSEEGKGMFFVASVKY